MFFALKNELMKEGVCSQAKNLQMKYYKELLTEEHNLGILENCLLDDCSRLIFGNTSSSSGPGRIPILSIVSQLMELTSSECKSLIQLIRVINCFFEKFQKQIGPRVGIGFRCSSYQTPLGSRNIDVTIPKIFITSGRERTSPFSGSWANWSRNLFSREREKLNDTSC